MPVHFATNTMGYLPTPIIISSLWEAMPTAIPMYTAINQKIRRITLILTMMQLLSAPWGAINFPPMGELSPVLKSLSALPVAITSGIQASLIYHIIGYLSNQD